MPAVLLVGFPLLFVLFGVLALIDDLRPEKKTTISTVFFSFAFFTWFWVGTSFLFPRSISKQEVVPVCYVDDVFTGEKIPAIYVSDHGLLNISTYAKTRPEIVAGTHIKRTVYNQYYFAVNYSIGDLFEVTSEPLTTPQK